MTTKMLTLRQYVDKRQKEMAKKYDLSIREINEAYPRDCEMFRQDWWEFNVVKNFDKNGAEMNMHVWRSLDARQRFTLLRTTRALRDDALTHELASATAK